MGGLRRRRVGWKGRGIRGMDKKWIERKGSGGGRGRRGGELRGVESSGKRERRAEWVEEGPSRLNLLEVIL